MTLDTSNRVAAPVSPDEIESLSRIGEEINLPSGSPLSSLGSILDNFYVLLDGVIRVHRRGSNQQERLEAHRGAAGYSEPLLLSPPAVIDALATGPCKFLRFSADVYLEWVSGFSPANAIIVSSLVQRVRTDESLLLEGEKLSALGKMAATLTHELNNPASAARRAAAELDDLLADLRSAALDLARHSLSPEHTALLSEFRQEAVESSSRSPVNRGAPRDPLEESDREAELGDWLKARRLAVNWRTPSSLARAGLDAEWLKALSTAIPEEVLNSAISWIAIEVAAASLISQLAGSTARISELVAAVKSYSNVDRAPMQEVDVHEGLESTLVMLGHRLSGIDLVRRYGHDLPRVCASAGELNQVWTHLVDNAIDALGGRGKIEIRTFKEDRWLVVEIADNGPGIPPEVQSRIFEAFFTTKTLGTGMGLGLDICRRIVAGQHGGDIRVDSTPGDTRFRVYLPVGPPLSDQQ